MSKQTQGWKGLINYIHTFLYGQNQPAKSRNNGVTTNSEANAKDESLHPETYRWFRKDELVRRCIIVNSSFATSASGFDTELEPVDNSLNDEQKTSIIEKYAYVKTLVDQINKQVNLDNILFIAQIKRSIFGKSGFEIILDKKGGPDWLLSLQSDKLKPGREGINNNWELIGLEYNGEPNKYKPENLLYFTNLTLENDHMGLSDIEPIMPVCESRHQLLKKDFPKITKRLWAPYAILKADTTGMPDTEEDTFLNDLTEQARAGESLGTNKQVEATIVDMNINITGLIQLMDKFEESIIRAFGTPRFLLNKPNENRATAFIEFEAYISGPIANIQRYFKRELERQWYPRLVKLALAKNGFSGDVPVKISHSWRKIRSSDITEMANAVNVLYNNGLGIIGDYPELAFEMMSWDKKLLEKTSQPTPENQMAPKTEQQKQDETVKPNGQA